MYLQVNNSLGVEQGYVNLDRMDFISLPSPDGENLKKVIVIQGTVSQTFYISYTELLRLISYLMYDIVRPSPGT